jgi:hypothetical protein
MDDIIGCHAVIEKKSTEVKVSQKFVKNNTVRIGLAYIPDRP